MWWRAALVVLALLAAFVPIPPPAVEELYSTAFYIRLESIITPVSNVAPFALFDAFVLLTAVTWIGLLIADLRQQGWRHMFVAGGKRTIVWVAALYLGFVVIWGFNYRRARLVDKLHFDPAAISPESAQAMATTVVGRLNALHGEAHAGSWAAFGSIEPSLAAAFDRVQRDLGARATALAARPKPTLLSPYFRRAAVSAMTDPYFLETLVQTDLLPFERPFVIAHEWSHLAGYADEAEGNFVGWLTCLHGSASDQYSGWLFLHEELSRVVSERQQSDVARRLGPGPQADLRAVARRLREQVNPSVSSVGWRVYDRYLKANHVETGVASYGEVVRLVLGVRFGPGWTPTVVVRPTGLR